MQAISTLMKAAVIGLVDNKENDNKRLQYEQLLSICVDELLDVGMSKEEVHTMLNNCLS